jgi:small GTP-binding protein
MMKILSSSQKQIITRERKLLLELQSFLQEHQIDPEDRRALLESIQQLDDLFLLVVVGEFNAGKSALINALLGTKTLKEGVTPTTTRINILRYGEDASQELVAEDILHLTAPVEFLREISIVDTPGTNAIIREHEEITSRFIPRSDLILFVTSADRPFTESERQFLKTIRRWKKKVVLAVNKIDILETPQELDEIQEFVRENVSKLLDISPRVFPVSAQQALRAKQGKGKEWEASQFEAFEDYIFQTLDQGGRLKLKLLNPVGVGLHLVEQYREFFLHRRHAAGEDLVLIREVEEQLDQYRQDMLESFRLRLAEIDSLLIAMENRGQTFFDEHLRLGRILDLLNAERIQQAFEQQVIGDVPEQIEHRTGRIIDWIVEANLRQWQAVTDHLAESRQKHQGRILGEQGGYTYERERYLQTIQKEASRVVDEYDREQESREIAARARSAVAAAAALEAGAVGLGTLISVLASTLAADITGIIIAGTIAALGFVIIPARRRKAKREMHAKITGMREELTTSLRAHFEAEINRSLENIRETFAPYARYLRSEENKHREALQTLEAYHTRLLELERRIEKSAG